MAVELLAETGAPVSDSMLRAGLLLAEVNAVTGRLISEIETYVNRVWDTQAGPSWVRWETENSPDTLGTSYPGPGTFGVHTSGYMVEYDRTECVETSTTECVGGVGLSPVRADITPDIANILCCPFSTDRTDLTTNHTFNVGTSTLPANVGYNNETMLRTEEGGGDEIYTGSSEPEHAIGGTDPVTFGAFMRIGFWNSTSQILTSSASGGDANYGLIRFTNGDWAFRGATGGGAGSAWQVMVNRDPEDTATYRWFHVAMRCNAGANTGQFFWNGTKIWDGTFGTNGRHVATATDQFSLNESHPSGANPRFSAWWGNIFIADSELTDAEIKELSDQSFGHASPYTPGGI